MKFFNDSEFKCPCGCGLSINDIQKDSLKNLEIARAFAATPFIITSSIRCEKHNTLVGGSETSSHLKGCAFDIHCESSSDRMKMVKSFLATSFTRIGIGKNFIHIDNDKDKPEGLIWLY